MELVLSTHQIITLIIFAIAFGLIAIEWLEKSIIALGGGLLMILIGSITPHAAIEAIEFETIFLLLGMMMLVNMASKSGILDWLNVQIAQKTGGNPVKIFVLFSLITAVFSAFLDNVTTVILVVPITIALLQGMGRDPRIFVLAEVLFSNVGGTLTLIGDPPNIIIGGATGLSFMDFVRNLWIPVSIISVLLMTYFLLAYRSSLQSISRNLVDLHMVNILIEKIKYRFLNQVLHKRFIVSVLLILGITILSFLLHEVTHMPAFVTAMGGAILLSLVCSRFIDIHHAYREVEWTTLFFFMGLFIMVGAVEHTGVLHALSEWVAGSTTNILYLCLMILWISGIVSMFLDNIPFVAVMIPVIFGIQAEFPGDTTIFWWALSMGACLGGNGTIIGASANVISLNIARQHGVHITFMQYFRTAFPLTICMLLICSGYLYWLLG